MTSLDIVIVILSVGLAAVVATSDDLAGTIHHDGADRHIPG